MACGRAMIGVVWQMRGVGLVGGGVLGEGLTRGGGGLVGRAEEMGFRSRGNVIWEVRDWLAVSQSEIVRCGSKHSVNELLRHPGSLQ